MYAKRMSENSLLLRVAAQRWEFVSRRSRRPVSKDPVLCIWPPDPYVLEFAEQIAFDSALCVVAGRHNLEGWIVKTNAESLVPRDVHVDENHPLPNDVAEALNAMLTFGGHNEFLGGGEKEDAVRTLRSLAARTDGPTPAALEAFVTASGETSAGGVQRVRQWYEETLAGKRHRDIRGHLIQ